MNPLDTMPNLCDFFMAILRSMRSLGFLLRRGTDHKIKVVTPRSGERGLARERGTGEPASHVRTKKQLTGAPAVQAIVARVIKHNYLSPRYGGRLSL